MEKRAELWGTAQVFLGVFFFAASTSIASIVAFTGVPEKIIVSGVPVLIYKEAVITPADGDASYNVYLTGYGTRVRKVGFIDINIYVASSYIDNTNGISPDNPLKSIRDSKAELVQITAIQNMNSDQIRSSIEDALDINGVNLSDPPVKKILNNLDFDVSVKETFSLISYPKGRQHDILWVEGPSRDFYSDGEDLGLTFWKNWFGIPIDNHMNNLKNKLIGKKVASFETNQSVGATDKPW